MSVGFFGRVSLKEALVNGVEECLLLGESGGVLGVAFDGVIEGLKPFEKFVAIEGATGELGNDLFDFGGDHVALAEIRVVENFAKDAFGEQVLHEHALNGIFREIGVDGLLAERVEIGESAGECGTLQALFFDQLFDGF